MINQKNKQYYVRWEVPFSKSYIQFVDEIYRGDEKFFRLRKNAIEFKKKLNQNGWKTGPYHFEYLKIKTNA